MKTETLSGDSAWRELEAGEEEEVTLPPGNFGWPVVGETLAFFEDPVKFTLTRREKYGSIFATHILLKPSVVITDPKLMKSLLLKESVLVEAQWPLSTRILLGESLPTQEGTRHKLTKRLLHDSSFGTRKVKDFHAEFAMSAEEYVNKWMNDSEAYMAALPNLKKFALDSSFRVAMGIQLSEDEIPSVLHHFELFVDGLFTLPVPLPGFDFYKGLQGKNRIEELVKQKIAEIREGKEKKVSSQRSALENLVDVKMEDGKLLYTDKQIQDEMLGLLFAGNDTVSTSATSLLLLLGCNDHIIEELRDEQRKVIAAHGPAYSSVAMKDMQLLEACIKEMLVVIPPIANVFRIAKQDIRIGDYKIPKGYQILFSLTVGMFIEHVKEGTFEKDWEEDVLKRFNPHRWINADSEPFFLPFGYGVRKCVGFNFAYSQLKILFSTILRRGTWKLVDDTAHAPWSTFPLPLPSDGLKVKFMPREL